ncbi:ATP-dependent RNA helicase HrpA [Oxalobacter paraformigenes]|nr:ATP-dependent RNA helicase HrpA [Oxalobacter paraformigenes]
MSAPESLSKKPRSSRQSKQATAKIERPPVPAIVYPEELPVSAKRHEIARAIQKHQVIVVCGETGSGKTTQLPKICLELGRGRTGLIGHTQPRRIAAITTANRIARELNSPPGEVVGYKIRFTDKTGPKASIKLMTDGILLAETQNDRLLEQYDTIIIDEAHERSLNIDFLLGYLKKLLPERPDLKVIITSATIDAERFARHFSTGKEPVPVIEVSGRLYPVEIRYRPVLENKPEISPAKSDSRQTRDLMDAIVDAVDELFRTGPGDTLVFLPGEREIRETAEILRKHHPPHVQILPLYARLSAQEQEKIFKPGNARRIILATNVAETSLTVPGIRFVIDTGLARVKRYSYRNKVEQLHIEPVSQAAANQRAGRCGRIASGICIRLYDEQDFLLRQPYTTPEILRSSLASVILRMKSLKLGDVDTFPFMEPPLKRAVADGYQLLQELGALDELNRLTSVGHELALLPLDPRIGRMILAARDHQCLREILIIAAALSIQDPRDRPIEAQEAADNAHKKFSDNRSEFISYLKIWNWFDEALKNKKSNRLLQENCRNQFLSFLRLREWRDIHTQLLTIVRERGWRLNESEATYEQLHLALLTGLLGNIGCKSEDTSVFLGARGIRFHIWPGSALARKNGRWIMAAELVDTSRLYARCIAQIQPEWLERVGKHLLKKSWSEPHWEKRPAQVSAYERATLYGLVVYSQRRVHYGQINPKEAREIFIREALVNGDFDTKAPFFAHNRQRMREIENLEHKSRRTDVLIDESLIAAFYDKHLPDTVINGFAFEKWHKDATKDNPKLLFLSRDDLMRHEAAGITTDLFPKTLHLAGIDMTLSYHFEPGNVRDGVTLTVPIYALNQLNAERCEWLVTGMLKEKTHLLIKSLPQKIRRNCVPLPDYASKFVDRIRENHSFGSGSLTDAIIADIREQTNAVAKKEDFRMETLPLHLFMNFRVVDENGRMLDMSRNLAALQAEFGKQARNAFQQLAALRSAGKKENLSPSGTPASDNSVHNTSNAIDGTEKITSWNFEPLPELLEIKRGKQSLIGYPALVDKTTHCEMEVFDDPALAKRTHHAGLRRLFALQLKEQLKFLGKNIDGLPQMGMQFIKLGSMEELRDQILQAALESALMSSPLPDKQSEFEKRINEGKPRIGLICNEIARVVLQTLNEYQTIQKKLSGIRTHEYALADINQQLSQLIGKQFITENSLERLKHFPRYLKACSIRIDKCRNDPQRDRTLLANWQQVATPYLRILKGNRQNHYREDPNMTEYRWLLEELRVSLFAQELRTPFPVSVKRLQKIWETMPR